MRSLTRITRLMYLLNKIWRLCPDMRFFQLLDMLQREFAEKKQAYKETLYRDERGWGMVEVTNIDLFYVEDDVIIEFLEEKLRMMASEKL